MSEDLSKLSEILPQPKGGRSRPDWSAVSSALGTELPDDYRGLIEKYGGGLLDDYLYILEPSSAKKEYDLVNLNEERTEALKMVWEDGEPKPSQLKGKARLIVWAATDDGQYVYWLADPNKSPDSWTVLVQEGSGPSWEHFRTGAVAFLAGVLAGDVQSELLDFDDLPDQHEYRPMNSL